MGRYIDGFVIPVPKDRIEDYRRMAEKAAPIWKEYGGDGQLIGLPPRSRPPAS
jgi:uncharacterized protein YbaA (DUF1428 family)